MIDVARRNVMSTQTTKMVTGGCMHWEPRHEDDIRLAIAEGNLLENTYLDVKRETGDTDGARRETAADLASFAIHGGAILVGVAEDRPSRALSLSPIRLAGAAEKIEQIAANRVDPPLFVRVRDIPSGEDPALGYVYVEIPPSTNAPHMVDGRYFARADRTKRRLTDAEVVQLHSGRSSAESQIAALLATWVGRRIALAGERQVGRLYLVGEPLMQPNGAAFGGVSRATNNTSAWELIAAVENATPRDLKEFSPRLSAVHRWVRRSEGGAMSSLEPGVPTIAADQREQSLLDVELRDNGGFRIVMGRLSVVSEQRKDRRLFDVGAVAYAWRAAILARLIAEQIGYRGAWGFGVHGDLLADASSFARQNTDRWFSDDGDPYSTDEYTEITTASLSEIEDAPSAIVNRLVGRLLHAVGSYDLFAQYVAPPDPSA